MASTEPENIDSSNHAVNGKPVTRTPIIGSLLSRIIFTGLLLLIILVPVPYGTVERWWEALFECAVFTLGILWSIDSLRSGRLLLREHWTLLAPLVILVAYALFQIIPLWEQTPPGAGRRSISFDPYETRLVATKFFALTIFLALLLRYTHSQRRKRMVVYSVIGIGLASAIFGLLRQVTQHGEVGFLLPYLQPNSGYGQFINKNHFPFLAEMTLGLLAGLIIRDVPRQRRLIYIALAVPVWTALVLSNSRGGILAMFSQVLFLALAFSISVPKPNNNDRLRERTGSRVARLVLRLGLVGALVLIIVVGMVWVGGDPLTDRLGMAREDFGSEAKDPTQTGRAAIWRATLRLCKAHPLTGVGFGGYWIAITRYHEGSGELVPQQAHNDYLELLASGGLIGVALVLWFMYQVLTRARLRLSDREPFNNAVTLGALAGLFGVAVHSLVDFGLHPTGNALICVALVALATNQATANSSQTQKLRK